MHARNKSGNPGFVLFPSKTVPYGQTVVSRLPIRELTRLSWARRWAPRIFFSRLLMRYHEPPTAVNSLCLADAMLTGTIESGLMRSDLEPRVRQSSRRNIVLLVDQNIEHPAALFTDEMLMALDEWIEMLGASEHQYLELFVGDQFLQIAINGSKAYVGQTFTHLIVNLIRSRVGTIVFDRLPDHSQLFRTSWLSTYVRHGYAVRSFTKDCRVSGPMTVLA